MSRKLVVTVTLVFVAVLLGVVGAYAQFYSHDGSPLFSMSGNSGGTSYEYAKTLSGSNPKSTVEKKVTLTDSDDGYKSVEIGAAHHEYEDNRVVAWAFEVAVDENQDGEIDRHERLETSILSYNVSSEGFQYETFQFDDLSEYLGQGERVLGIAIRRQMEFSQDLVCGESYFSAGVDRFVLDDDPIIPRIERTKFVEDAVLGDEFGTKVSIPNDEGTVIVDVLYRDADGNGLPDELYTSAYQQPWTAQPIQGSFTFEGVRFVVGTTGDDVIQVDPSYEWVPHVIFAGPGNNEVHGSRRGDFIVAGNGDNEIRPNGGPNLVDPGRGETQVIYNHELDVILPTGGKIDRTFVFWRDR